MKNTWRAMIGGAMAALAVAADRAPAQTCGDFNGDGNRTIADALFLSSCLGLASCPAPTASTDLLEDGALNDADLAVLVDTLAGLETLFDLCEGPGPDLSGCPGPVTVNSQTIGSSQVWPAGCDIRLSGTVFVETAAAQPTTVLTIEPGTTIKAVEGSPDPAALIFLPGAKINAQGTPDSPIVFTSNQPVGNRSKGDWAGVMFNGRATVNRPNCLANAEGIPTAFGGCDPNDSSGIARYVRVEYAGLDFTPNNELNLWTMNGVGGGTVFDHIHAHAGDDDCLEWFGGTVNTHHMVASGCGDDGFDWQLGYTGSLQYGLMLQHGQLTDATARDSRGMEGDNSEFGNDDLPRSNPKFCNFSMVSTLASTGDNGGSDAGILLRRGTAGTIANSIVTGFQDAGVELRDVATTQQACADSSTLAGDLIVRSSVFFENGDSASGFTEHCKTGTISGGNCSTCEWYALLVASENVVNADGSNATDPGVSQTYPSPGNLYDGRPTGTLPSPASCSAISEHFQDTAYVGAFDPARPAFDWLSQPWNNFDEN